MVDRAVQRRVSLPDGRTIQIRPVEQRDVDGLSQLYAGLDDDSRYRRFFCIHRPKRAFFERMTSIRERGGAGLVVTLVDAEVGERIIAEAGYELLPNGNGELEITVERAWRGWLGPYLLDALVEAAAAYDVPNLEADMLTTNGPMLALLRSRGWVIIPTGDWAVIRAMISTGSSMPVWPLKRDVVAAGQRPARDRTSERPATP